jgi:hypothetical protein
MPRIRLELLALMCFALLLVTNRYATVSGDTRLIQGCCSDSHSYRVIADAFPGLPGEGAQLDFHHAQRFTIPWLVGGLSQLTPLSGDDTFRLAAIALALATILLTARLLRRAAVSDSSAAALLVLFIFNAYAFRFDLAFPWYVNDQAFVLGLVIVMLGLSEIGAGTLLAGLALAAISRQTALLLLPSLLAWLALEGGCTSRRKRIGLGLASVAIACGIYVITARVAGGFAGPNTNFDKITAIGGWLAHDFSAAALAEFGARLLLPFVPLLAIGAALALRPGDSRIKTDARFWILLSFTFAVAAQPTLGGPVVTDGNAQRLVMLGFVPALLALSRLLRINAVELSGGPRFWLIFGAAAFMTSMHHIYSFAARDDSHWALTFAVIFFSSSAALGMVSWGRWRSVR